MESWFPERTANFYSVLSRENSTVTIIIFCLFRSETVARGLDDVSLPTPYDSLSFQSFCLGPLIRTKTLFLYNNY